MKALIRAHKYVGVEHVFAFINRYMLSRHFHQIWVSGFEQLREVSGHQPLLFYANHSNWWDGLIAFYLSYDLLKLDAYLMMLARQLDKYRFFRWIGAFSVDPTSPISAYHSLQYAAKLLQLPTKSTHTPALWLFPQGEMLPNDIRPLKFSRGLSWLASQIPTLQLVSVAFRYEFLNEQLPEAFLSFARPREIDKERVKDRVAYTLYLQQELTLQLDQLKDNVVHQHLDNYQAVLSGGMSINIAYERALKLFKRRE